MGWLAGYNYRKQIPITGQAGAGADYQVPVEVHPGAGADAAGVVYLNGHSIDFPNDVRFTDDDETTLLDHWIDATEHFADRGTSQPFYFVTHPTAIYYNGKTYVVWQGQSLLDPHITYYNHVTKEWGPIVKVASNPLSSDDHGAPSVIIDNNGYIHVFYGCHGSALKHAKSNNPEDISAFTVQADVTSNAAYPKPIVDGNDMYVFYRKTVSGTDFPQCYRKSPDNGASWGGENTIIEKPAANGRVYVGRVERDGIKIHMGWCYANAGDTLRYNLYHAYLNTSDGKMYSIGGVDLGTTITEAEANTNCKVVDSGADYLQAPSLHLDSSGHPWMIYIQGSNTTFTFYHVRWNGAAWTAPESITTTDFKYNWGDFIINSTTDVEAYLTTSGQAGRGGDIQRWDWNGAAWGLNGTILAEAAAYKPLNDPMIPVNFVSELKLVFAQTNPDTLTDVVLKLYAYGGSGFLTKCWGPFWVKVDDNLDANQDIYIYYGKSGAASAADGDDTFVLFDGFPSTSLDAVMWNNNIDGNDSLAISDGLALILNDVGGVRSVACLDSKNTFVHPCAVESRWGRNFKGPTGGVTTTAVRFAIALHPTSNVEWNLEAQFFACGHLWHDNSPNDWLNALWTEIGAVVDNDLINHVDIKESLILKSGASKEYRDDILELSNPNASALGSPAYFGLHYVMNPTLAIGSQYIYVAFVAMRKYIAPEPVVGTAGGEELNPDVTPPRAPAYGLDPIIF